MRHLAHAFGRIVLLIGLMILSAVQIVLALLFWQSFADDGWHLLLFQALGIGFVLVEIMALHVAADAAAAGHKGRANIFRLVFVGLFAINLVSDLGAIYAFTSADAETRRAAVVSQNNAAADRAALEERRAVLKADLKRQDLDRPAASLLVERDLALARSAAAAGEDRARAGRWKRRAQALTAAADAALEIERIDGALKEMRQSAQPVAADHPQIAALVKLAGWTGLCVTAEDMRVMLALAMAVVLRFVLAFGFWTLLPTKARSPDGEGAANTPDDRTPGPLMPLDPAPEGAQSNPRGRFPADRSASSPATLDSSAAGGEGQSAVPVQVTPSSVDIAAPTASAAPADLTQDDPDPILLRGLERRRAFRAAAGPRPLPETFTTPPARLSLAEPQAAAHNTAKAQLGREVAPTPVGGADVGRSALDLEIDALADLALDSGAGEGEGEGEGESVARGRGRPRRRPVRRQPQSA